MFYRHSLRLVLLSALLPFTSNAFAQALEDFLACADYSDRVERVFCLENALDEAVSATSQSEETAPVDALSEKADTTPVESFGREPEVADVTARPAEASEAGESAEEQSGFRLPVIGNLFRRNRDESAPDAASEESTAAAGEVEDFGRQARVASDEEGEEVLFDVVAELDMFRPSILQITLASGQVWRQLHPKRYNLRAGDAIRIYSTGWGDNFRLETERLSGFIQIGRVD